MDKRQVGELGEDIACRFLVKQGHKIRDRNYRKKWGEIDIISEKDNIIHFIEVKSVSRETLPSNVNHETNSYTPEDNVHPWKLKRIYRTIQTYLLDKKVYHTKQGEDETEWQIDIIAVFLNIKTRKAKVRITENII
ncbi:MAG: YraN family protein [Parcubacteria group bacterium]|nr:YraN family protein [Parcubacteria group bacterium]MCR4342852.1 YraN family protein [Patescibacteria group bacterium]